MCVGERRSNQVRTRGTPVIGVLMNGTPVIGVFVNGTPVIGEWYPCNMCVGERRSTRGRTRQRMQMTMVARTTALTMMTEHVTGAADTRHRNLRKRLTRGTFTSTMRRAARICKVRCWRWLFGNKITISWRTQEHQGADAAEDADDDGGEDDGGDDDD